MPDSARREKLHLLDQHGGFRADLKYAAYPIGPIDRNAIAQSLIVPQIGHFQDLMVSDSKTCHQNSTDTKAKLMSPRRSRSTLSPEGMLACRAPVVDL